MKICWIKPDGEIVDCSYPNNHTIGARMCFPESSNPERACEKAGYVKVCAFRAGYDHPFHEHEKELTQAQTNVLTMLWEEHYKEKRGEKVSYPDPQVGRKAETE